MTFPRPSGLLHGLLDRLPMMPLDAGRPDSSVTSLLVAGLWLAYNHLDECHAIAQCDESPDGNTWHAIMHRREGDFWNSKYWFRRVEEHPIAPLLRAEAARTQIHTHCRETEALVTKPQWNPFMFADLCERALKEGGVLEDFCRRTQRAQGQLLFNHCLKKATAK